MKEVNVCVCWALKTVEEAEVQLLYIWLDATFIAAPPAGRNSTPLSPQYQLPTVSCSAPKWRR